LHFWAFLGHFLAILSTVEHVHMNFGLKAREFGIGNSGKRWSIICSSLPPKQQEVGREHGITTMQRRKLDSKAKS